MSGTDKLVSDLADIFASADPTPFALEGAVIAWMRAQLCLGGLLWAPADRRARTLAWRALDQVGAERPGYDEAGGLPGPEPGFALRPVGFCLRCGAQLPPPASGSVKRQRYCSHLCTVEAYHDRNGAKVRERDAERKRQARAARPNAPPRPCRWCGTIFEPRQDSTRYCSPSCWNHERYRMAGDGPKRLRARSLECRDE